MPIRDRELSTKPSRGTVTVLSRKRFQEDAPFSHVLKEEQEHASRQVKDPFTRMYDGVGMESSGFDSVLRPPYNPVTLRRLPVHNNKLFQCIQAMVTNCDLLGHTLNYIGPKGEEESDEAAEEKQRIEDLLANPNDSEKFPAIRRKLRTDYETLGYAFVEVGRDADEGIAFFFHIPAETVRLCPLDPEFVEVTMRLMRNGEMQEIRVRRQFRRFVQLVGSRRIYFKEFGDPRIIDPKTGKESEEIDPAKGATEIIHLSQYWSGEPYGIPRWINNLPSIIGAREAELANVQFFSDNAIPAMAILVSGGRLSPETMAELEEKFTSKKGRDSIHRVVVVEAVPDLDTLGSTESTPPVPTLTLQPLRNAQQGEELFDGYLQSCADSIRSAFRLPPIYLGNSDDYTRATAESSAQVAEHQVFGPERNEFDDMMNRKILAVNGEAPKYWEFRSNGARLVDPTIILQALTTLEALGGATPNLAIQIANELLGMRIARIEAEWGNLPFAFVKGATASGDLGLTDEQQSAITKAAELIRKADAFSPPQAVRNAAKQGLELRRKFNRGGTSIGVARARDLKNGKKMPLETIKRMHSYFSRHETDKKASGWKPSEKGYPSSGFIAWQLWGGDAGKKWVESIMRKIK